MYTYSLFQWLAFFYIYCFLGWCFESTYVSVNEHRPVNRGFVRGPLLPLYGSGALMMLIVSMPYRGNILLTYISGVIGATALEYATGFVMERLFKVRYWDYSHKKLQINGYICLSSSIAWGFLTILVTDLIHKPIENIILQLPAENLAVSVSAVSIFFLFDTINSVSAALDIAHAITAMEKVRAELEDIQVQLALLRMSTSEKLADIKDNTAGKLLNIKDSTSEKLAGIRENTVEKLGEITSATTEKIGEITSAATGKIGEITSATTEKIGEVTSATTEKLGEITSATTGKIGEITSATTGKLGEITGSTGEKFADFRDNTALKLYQLKDEAEKYLEELSLEYRQRPEYHKLRIRMYALRKMMPSRGKLISFFRRGLLLGNPDAKSKYEKALSELKEFEKHKRLKKH